MKTSSVDAYGWHDGGDGPGTKDGKFIPWLTFNDQAQSVTEDVERIRSSSMVSPEIPIYGYIDDCKTGKLIEIPEATEAGRAARDHLS